VHDVLDPARLRRAGLFDAGRVEHVVDEHLRGRRDERRVLWSLLAFELWRREYLGDAGAA
jgi:asparagine synthase (glutamine-hydrolysing)